MGRGRLKSGLRSGAGRLRRIPSLTIEQIIVDPPPPESSTNPDISQGGGIITPSGGTIFFSVTGGGLVGEPSYKSHQAQYMTSEMVG